MVLLRPSLECRIKIMNWVRSQNTSYQSNVPTTILTPRIETSSELGLYTDQSDLLHVVKKVVGTFGRLNMLNLIQRISGGKVLLEMSAHARACAFLHCKLVCRRDPQVPVTWSVFGTRGAFALQQRTFQTARIGQNNIDLSSWRDLSTSALQSARRILRTFCCDRGCWASEVGVEQRHIPRKEAAEKLRVEISLRISGRTPLVTVECSSVLIHSSGGRHAPQSSSAESKSVRLPYITT